MEISFDLLQTTAVGAAVVFLGFYLRRKFPVLIRYCLPGPVIAGLTVSVLLLAARLIFGLSVRWSLENKEFFMDLFFTCVGFSASAKLLKKGGFRIMAGIAVSICALIVLQNVMGIAIASVMGMHPLNGLACSSVSTAGGVGTAAAFGPVFEELGAPDSTVIGVTAGTFGLIAASLAGGPVAGRIIRKNRLTPTDPQRKENCADHQRTPAPASESMDSGRLLHSWCLILVVGGLGTYISFFLQKIPMIEMPYFIGCIFSGVIARNLMEAAGMTFHEKEIGTVSDVSLDIFLALAIMSVDLTRLLNSAAAMVVILAAQAVLIIFWAHVSFRYLFGNDFNAAVMAAGLIGTGMGSGSNAVANEKAVIEEYGPSEVAWVVFPAWSVIVVDIFNPLFISLAAAPVASLARALHLG